MVHRNSSSAANESLVSMLLLILTTHREKRLCEDGVGMTIGQSSQKEMLLLLCPIHAMRNT